MPRDYKKIKSWQIAKKLTFQVYQLTKNFPASELYGIVSQLRRAAVSVICNIAEGASRQHKRDYLNFLYNARASMAEVECLLGFSLELEYVSIEQHKAVSLSFKEAAQSLYGLIQSVQDEV